MTDHPDALDELFHEALTDYPAQPLPTGFQTAVLARIESAERPVVALAHDAPVAERLSLSFLELSSALLMGLWLSAALVVVLVLVGLGPESWALPPTLPLAGLTLSPSWLLPALLLLAVEVVLIILAGLQITES